MNKIFTPLFIMLFITMNMGLNFAMEQNNYIADRGREMQRGGFEHRDDFENRDSFEHGATYGASRGAYYGAAYGAAAGSANSGSNIPTDPDAIQQDMMYYQGVQSMEQGQ